MLITPPPPFWPDNALEWVTLVGGILGTFAFILSILNYRRDRAKIRLRFRPGMRVRAPGYDPNTDHLVLIVVNEGRRSVQIAHAAAQYYRGDGFTFADTLVRGAPVLSEESPEATIIAKQEFNVDDIWYFYVAAPVRERRVYVHPIPRRWWHALRTWPKRIRLRREVRERRRKKLEKDELLVAKQPSIRA